MDPMARSRNFLILREAGWNLHFGDEPLKPETPEDQRKADEEAVKAAAAGNKDPFKLRDPMNQPVRTPNRSQDPAQQQVPERTPLKATAPPERTPLKTSEGNAQGDQGFLSRAWGAMKTTAKDPTGQTKTFAGDLVKGGDAKSGLGQMLGWNKKTRLIDRIQDTVDVIGIVDPTGIADAANTVGYAARGEWGKAATSALGLIPYLGDLGKIGKYAGRGGKAAGKAAKIEGAAAKVAARKAEKAALVHGVEAGAKAAKPVGRVARMKQAYARGKELYGKGKEVFDRAKGTYEKIQQRRAEREGGAPPSTPGGPPPAQRPAAPPSGGAAPTGPTQGGAGGGGASGRTKEAGRLLVPVGADCPPGQTKTSRWGAPPGKKRCFGQTPGREHD